ncbi:aminotransferase class III-fold pyridoxal phosphate-dependent enzyme [Pseudodesulfovibrio piezophilus]|uniref:Aminotransferase class-III n=1 Tax=Pseudodesulfovibrio piezophilus (strain DSM 21447 / JCM 15486 / C1TLV30) TaxID=1322246 RepID=M1WJW4_PSEP2|nr:aminotransferase class III-fold pyridoxal phosphate-dependent enzyme [Pseudodesulfovibrio piezophilus]CCH48591.1 conserved protein of unknown function [Pseudodesulfovibrio piezophilus C1TLV30]
MNKSQATQDNAKRRIPGMTQLLSKRPDRFSEGVWPGYFSKAKGAHVWDLDGNKYLDMSIGGIGATVLGYADSDVDEAVKRAISLGCASSLNCAEELELADTLCESHPWATQVKLGRSGGEAMTIAVRIARAATGRDVVAFCGYHGWHDWYLAANLGTKNALGEHLINGLDPAGVPQKLKGTAFPFRYNELEELEKIVAEHGHELAAIVMEPIRGTEPSPDFFPGVRAIADRTGASLIVDEISAGFRLYPGGAHMKLFDQRPDMAVFAKAMGNGYPIAAVIGREKFMSAAQSTFISSTNWTERLGPTAALATIKKYDSHNVHEHLTKIGSMVQEGWTKLGQKHSLDLHVGGMKAMSHFAFSGKNTQAQKAYFVQLMLEEGILACNSMYAMYAHTEADVEHYLKACDKSFAKISASGDTVADKLHGKPSAEGFERLA